MEEAMMQAARDAGVREEVVRKAMEDTNGMTKMMATDEEANICVHASLMTYVEMTEAGFNPQTILETALARCYYIGLQRGRAEGANDIS